MAKLHVGDRVRLEAENDDTIVRCSGTIERIVRWDRDIYEVRLDRGELVTYPVSGARRCSLELEGGW
jgi:hypothetical protein